MDSYWTGTGKHDDLRVELDKLVPLLNSVPKGNPKLEKFRKASNCYYDLFNNGLCNRAAEFYRVFGFGGRTIAKNGYLPNAQVERKMDEIIYEAAVEQKLARVMSEIESQKLLEKHGADGTVARKKENGL